MDTQWLAMDFGGPEALEQVAVDLPEPGPGQVAIEVRAAGMNPADYKRFGPGQDKGLLPLTVGYEVAGVIRAIGPGTTLAWDGGGVGAEVVAFRIMGGYASAVNVDAGDVFAKPSVLSFPEAANLLLVGTTAAELLDTAGVKAGETILVHGAAGGVGASVLQQARLLGARVIGTASEANFGAIRGYGATAVRYGPGLEQRVRAAASDGIAAALDTVGTDEAVEVSLALVGDRKRIVTIAAFARADSDGFQSIGLTNPASGPFRAAARTRILAMAAQGQLTVPIAHLFEMDDARTAVTMLMGHHPFGKLALIR